MMKTTSVLIAIILFAAISEPVNGQPTAPGPEGPPLSLKQAIQTALEKHPSLQSAEFAVRGADARAKQAEAYYYPQVDSSVFQTNGSLRANAVLQPAGTLIERNQSDISVGVVARQRIYDFGQTKSRVDAQRSETARFEKDALTRRAQVVLGVEQVYMSVLKRKRLVQIAEQTVRERDVIKQQVETLYRNQIKSKLDLGLVQVQLTDAEFLLIRARNDLAATYAELNNAMGIEGPPAYSLEDLPVVLNDPGDLPALLSDAMGRRPELLSLKERMRTAQHRIDAATRSNFPVVQALGSAGDTEHISDRPALREGGWWGVGAAVSVPLFTGFLIQNQVAEARAQFREAEAGYLALVRDVQLQVTDSFLDLGTLIRQVKVSQDLLAYAREALSLAQQRYRLGLSSIVEVTQSEIAVTGADTRLAETQYNAKIAEARLRYAVGGI